MATYYPGGSTQSNFDVQFRHLIFEAAEAYKKITKDEERKAARALLHQAVEILKTHPATTTLARLVAGSQQNVMATYLITMAEWMAGRDFTRHPNEEANWKILDRWHPTLRTSAP